MARLAAAPSFHSTLSLAALLFSALLLILHPTLVSAYTDPFICLVNAARAQNGVPPVGFSSTLQAIAKRQAGDMEQMASVTHSGADGSNPLTRLTAAGFGTAGENVAGGQSTPSWAMTSFMQSPGHRANILNAAYNCFGGARAGDKWAQEFGSAEGCVVPDCSRRARLARREEPEVVEEIAEAVSFVVSPSEVAKAVAGKNSEE